MQILFDTDGEETDSGGADDPCMPCVSVLIPCPVPKAYSYAVPSGMGLPAPGCYVSVPFSGRTLQGVVWAHNEQENTEDFQEKSKNKRKTLKSLINVYDTPPMPEVHRDFIRWVADYTMIPLGHVLKMSLRAPDALTPPEPVPMYRLSAKACENPVALSPQARGVVACLSDGRPRRAVEIAALCGCSPGLVRGMAARGVIESCAYVPPPPCTSPDIQRKGAMLSADQRAAADKILAHVGTGSFHAALLDGVTGSGKTEVYFEAIAKCLEKNQQTLLMLPEIALSNAFLGRFESRFGCAPALWHSRLTQAQRRRTWRGVASGETKVVVGARSALFLPYADLGLIVVDEEHEPAYKQEEGGIYHARDMAVVRARLGRIPVVLVSATPSLETVHNAWTGRYAHLHLPDRFGGARLPDITLVDLRAHPPERGSFIAPPLIEAMEATLAAGEQVLLFLNRRGYAPLTLCRACGHRLECPRCTAWLVEHRPEDKSAGAARGRGRLQCHHCGYGAPLPKTCPTCDAADSLTPCGPGVERVLEEAMRRFPQSRALLLASDTAETPESLTDMLESIRNGHAQIIVGTQIIAKGHHFPGLTCVGVIDADLGLQGGDLRATERTYQLLHQVAGRAGREERKGCVYLQTWNPKSRVMQALAAGERDIFLEIEAYERESAGMPPYTRLAALIVSGREESEVESVAKTLGRTAPQAEGVRTLGPAPAPMARLKGRHRRRLLVIADKKIHIQKTIADWIAQIKIPSSVKVAIDIDPQGFL